MRGSGFLHAVSKSLQPLPRDLAKRVVIFDEGRNAMEIERRRQAANDRCRVIWTRAAVRPRCGALTAVKAADRRLYRAKRLGKNRVVHEDGPPPHE